MLLVQVSDVESGMSSGVVSSLLVLMGWLSLKREKYSNIHGKGSGVVVVIKFSAYIGIISVPSESGYRVQGVRIDNRVV